MRTKYLFATKCFAAFGATPSKTTHFGLPQRYFSSFLNLRAVQDLCAFLLVACSNAQSIDIRRSSISVCEQNHPLYRILFVEVCSVVNLI